MSAQQPLKDYKEAVETKIGKPLENKLQLRRASSAKK